MGEGERGREKDRYTRLACVAGEKGEVEEGERKREGGEKGRVSYPLSPIPLPFSLFLAIPNPFRRLLRRLKDRLHSAPWDFWNAGGFSL